MKGEDFIFQGIVPTPDSIKACNKSLDSLKKMEEEHPIGLMNGAEMGVHMFTSGFSRGMGYILAQLDDVMNLAGCPAEALYIIKQLMKTHERRRK